MREGGRVPKRGFWRLKKGIRVLGDTGSERGRGLGILSAAALNLTRPLPPHQASIHPALSHEKGQKEPRENGPQGGGLKELLLCASNSPAHPLPLVSWQSLFQF